ncbi:MAG: hypothetical protein QXK24_02250 [Ignisphaera sp.]
MPKVAGSDTIPADIPAIQDPKVAELGDAVRELVEASTKLVIKLAICECKEKNCPILAVAKQIAKAIDKLQTINPP